MSFVDPGARSARPRRAADAARPRRRGDRVNCFCCICSRPVMALSAPSQRGSMSAAGESGLRIVIATCAGGSTHRRGEVEIEALQRQALALGAEPTTDFAPWVLLGMKIDQCPHSAEGDMRARNEGQGLTHFGHWRKKFAVMHNAAFLVGSKSRVERNI
jgi:hypothetical protein